MQFDFSTDTITPDLTTLLLLGGTGALQLAAGTTAQRPGTAGAGTIRWNTSLATPAIEFYNGSAWGAVGDASALTGTTLASNVVSSSLTSVGTLTSLKIAGLTQSTGHLLIGDSINNANVANCYVPGTPSGVNADRPINFIDSAAVMKIVRVGGNPALELQEWDSAITTNIGYWDWVSVSGQFQLRDRSNPVTTVIAMTANKTTGNVGFPGTVTAAAISTSVSTKTANYSLVSTDSIILVNGAYTMTLPSAATAGSGTQYTIKRIGTGTTTINSSSGTIDGSASVQLTTQYSSVTVVSDGTSWWII